MARTITVKGVGSVSTTPDYVVISMDLETKDRDYEAGCTVCYAVFWGFCQRHGSHIAFVKIGG